MSGVHRARAGNACANLHGPPVGMMLVVRVLDEEAIYPIYRAAAALEAAVGLAQADLNPVTLVTPHRPASGGKIIS
jgi:hypothetical protein